MTSGAPPAKARVLYVDDAEDVREVFGAVFGDDFDVLVARADALVRERLTPLG